MKAIFPHCLSLELREELRKALTKAHAGAGLRGGELREAVETGMNSKIADLRDVINTRKYERYEVGK